MLTTLEQLRDWLRDTADVPDGELLARFVARRDGDAFAALLDRHGPLVWGVCRRVLGDRHAAEDAFQATFLVLVRNPSAVRRPDALAAWLHGVAFRLAVRTARRERHRRAAEAGCAPRPGRDPLDELSARELLVALDATVQQLPESERLPLVLCGLDGCSLDEAAARLGLSAGAVKGRLERGRARLRRLLKRRGLSVPTVLGAGLLLAPSSGVARSLLETTTAICLGAAPPSNAVSGLVAVPSRFLVRASVLLSVLTVGGGLLMAGRPAPPAPPPANPPARPRVDIHGDPLPDGAVMRLGTVGFRVPGVAGVGFRPSGELVAITDNLTLHVWPADGSPNSTVFRMTEKQASGERPALAPNARYAAEHLNGRLTVWDLSVNPPVEHLSRELSAAYRMCFSANGTWLAVPQNTSGSERILLCDLTNKTWDDVSLKGRRIGSLSFTPDGKSLLVVATPTVVVIDAATRRERFTLQIPQTQVECAALSPDGSVLAVQPYKYFLDPEPELRLFSVPSGKPVEGLKPPKSRSDWIGFSPDGKAVLFGDSQGVRTWGLTAGKLVSDTPGPALVPAVFSADRRRFATYSRSAVLLADAATGQPARPDLIDAGHTASVFGILVSPDGKRIATFGHDNDLRMWDAATGRPLYRVPLRWRQVVFLPDSKSFITVAEDWVTPVEYDAATGRERRRFAVSPEVTRAEMTRDLRLSPDGRTLTTSTYPAPGHEKWYTVRWDIASGREISRSVAGVIQSMRKEHEPINSPDNRWVVLRGAIVRVGGNVWIPLIPPAEVSSSHVCYSDDSRFVALPRVPRKEKGFDWNQSRVVVVDLASLMPLAELATGEQVLRVAFSPDARQLAVVGVNETVVWDLRSGKPERRFRTDGAIGSSLAVAFTPDGRRLITGHDDCTALVWDVAGTRRPTTAQLTPADLAQLWDALAAADAAKGFAAVWDLADRPAQAIAFLRERLKPAQAVDAATVRRLVTDLNDAAFARREAAGRELRTLGEGAVPHLRAITKGVMTAEARGRVEWLLADIDNDTVLTGNRLRQVRAVAVLERAATDEARKLLTELAGGLAEARLTKEAAEAVGRWRR